MLASFKSEFRPVDRVRVFGEVGTVVAVKFFENPSKVTYDIDLEAGGAILCNVDSTFVEQPKVFKRKIT